MVFGFLSAKGTLENVQKMCIIYLYSCKDGPFFTNVKGSGLFFCSLIHFQFLFISVRGWVSTPDSIQQEKEVADLIRWS